MLSLHTLALNQGHRVNGAPHKLCRTLSILRLPCISHCDYHSASFAICAEYWTSCSLHNPQCVDCNFVCISLVRVYFSCLWPPNQEWVVFWNSILCLIIRWFSESQAYFWLNYEVVVVVDPVELTLFQDVDCCHLVHVVDVVHLLGAFLLSLRLLLGIDNSMEA